MILWITPSFQARSRAAADDRHVCGTKKKLNKKRIGASQIDTRPPVRRRTTPIPANEIKITLRPNQGLALGQVGSIELGIAIITEVGKPHICGKNDFTAYIRYGSNIVVISTARTDTAEEIKKITRLRLRGRLHEFHTHVVMGGTIKGVIHGISAGTKEEELMKFLDTRNDSNRIVQARMMGRSKTALLTFIGDRLPKVVYGMGTIISVNPYVPTRQVCYSCMKPGHRIDVCPFPDVKACQRCGKRQPEENHMCVPRCVLCGGEHVTGDKECKQKYKARFQAGSHQQGMSQRKEGEERKERKWQPQPETRRNEVIRKKYTEEDYPQLPASPWAAAATMTTATMGKGPTEETRRLRAHLGRKEAEVEKMKDEMATMRNEIRQLRNALKTQTERKNSEKPAYRAKPKPRGETLVPKTPSNEAQEMKQEMIKELKQEIQKWMTDMFKNPQIGRGAEENPPNKRRKNPYSKDKSNYESDSSSDFRSLFREASKIVGGNALVLVGDFNARHTSWGYQEDSKKGKQLAAAIDNERLEIINDLLRPTRTGNSINRDTNPDLTMIKNLDQHKVTWKNTEETIGSDHAIIEISVEASTNRRKIGASKMTNWNKFRHLGPEGGIEDLETWVAELQATKAHCTKEISLTEAIPGVDTHLLGLWEKRKGIVKRWKKQKHNRKLRLRISVLNKQTEEYATQLAQQNWGQKCDSLQGTLGLAQTWRLLHHLVSPAQTKSEGCKTTLKIVHSYKGTDEDLLKQIKKKYIGSLGEKEERLQRAADTVHVYVKSRGLRCSPEKSEIIRIHRNGYDRGVPINVSLDGQDIPEVKQLRILGMWIQHNGKATRTIQLLQKTTEQVTNMITRITNRRRGLKEKDVMKLIQALVISRVVYSLPYHYLDMKEQEQVEVLIRKTYKIALGLPQNAPTAKLEQMGVHNTFQEHKEALLMAQRSRLKKSGTGRQLIQKLGYGDCTEVIQNSRELGAGVKGTYIVRPIPKHMNPIMHRGRRRARAQYYEREGKDNEKFVYVDAGDYRRDAKVAVALDHAYDEISSCSIKNASMVGAEEHAIALAMIHGYRTKKSYTFQE
ncbi:uncharacterized protein ISCGN_004126 [Ixodes scapularis]